MSRTPGRETFSFPASGKPIKCMKFPQPEREYGVNRSTISGWVKQLSPIKVSEEETVTLREYKALQKENQRLKTENEILKKATAIFAKEQ